MWGFCVNPERPRKGSAKKSEEAELVKEVEEAKGIDKGLRGAFHPSPPHLDFRSPDATATSNLFPGRGNGQTQWPANARRGGTARFTSTTVRPSASDAAGHGPRKR
jgi:hypothetical protein